MKLCVMRDGHQQAVSTKQTRLLGWIEVFSLAEDPSLAFGALRKTCTLETSAGCAPFDSCQRERAREDAVQGVQRQMMGYGFVSGADPGSIRQAAR